MEQAPTTTLRDDKSAKSAKRLLLPLLFISVISGGCSKCASNPLAMTDAAAGARDASSNSDPSRSREEPAREEEPPKRALALDVHGENGSAAYSPDGRWLATGSSDAIVWDRATFNRVAILPGGSNSMDVIAWSPDSKRLAVIGEGIRVFDLEEARRVHDHGAAVSTRDQDAAVTATADAGIGGHSSATTNEKSKAKPIASYKPDGGNLTLTLAWTADGSNIDFVSGDGVIARISASDGTTVRSVRPKTTPLDFGNAVFTKDHRRVLLGERMSGTIMMVDTTSGQVLKRFAPSPNEVMLTFELDPSDRRLLVVYNGESAFRIFDVDSGTQTAKIQTKETRIEAASFSNDGATIAVAGFGGSVRLFNVARSEAERGSVSDHQGATMRETAVLGPHPRTIEGVAWSTDNKELAVVPGVEVTLWDVAKLSSPKIMTHLPSFSVGPDLTVCSKDGRVVATHNLDHGVFVFHTDSGEMATFPDQVRILDDVRVIALGVTTNASRVTTVNTVGAVTHWDVATKARTTTTTINLEGHGGFSEGRPLISPDGRHLVALPRSVRQTKSQPGSNDQTIFVWSLDNGSVESRANVQFPLVSGSSATWSPQSDVVAVSSSAGQIAIIDTKTGTHKADLDLGLPPFRPRSDIGSVRTVPVVFTPDGERIFTRRKENEAVRADVSPSLWPPLDKTKGVDVWRISTRSREGSSDALSLGASAEVLPGEKWIADDGAIYDAKTGTRAAWTNAHLACVDPKGRWGVFVGSTLLFLRPDGTWLSIDIVPAGVGWATVAIASDETFDAPESVLPWLHFTYRDRTTTAKELAPQRREGLARTWLARE